ncbi:MAG: SpoIIE family protein phosphatase [Anaerolineales bacterium]|jgi:sigma-B regulation protein RsbU (phosphoserine phosphatase)
MSIDQQTFLDLTTLNKIAEALNRSPDARTALQAALSRLIELMRLETGWIFLVDETAKDQRWGEGFILAAHHNLPPALDPTRSTAWIGGCDCQTECQMGRLNQAYNEIECSRLAAAQGERRGLTLHASAPLVTGGKTIGILNVAARDRSAFDRRSLSLLESVGNQIGSALERTRLYDSLQSQRLHEQSALLDLSNQLLQRRKLDELIHFVVQTLRVTLNADACALIMASQDPDWLEFWATDGWQEDPIAAGRRIPNDTSSGPGWVLSSQHPLVIEDLLDENLTTWAPDWLRKEGFRGHAVVPLLAEDRPIGTLVLNTRQPRSADEAELRFLQLMANQAAIAIEKARLHEEERQRQRLEDELAVARSIQLQLLPASLPQADGWEFAAAYQAARQVGGDFYDVFSLPDDKNRLGFIIADVSGKGVPAALFMAMSRTLLRTTALSGRSPRQAMIRANELMHKDTRAELFLSAFYLTLDTNSGEIVFTSAGHNPPYLIRGEDGKVLSLDAHGVILGAFEEIELEQKQAQLNSNDVLVLYTDGITEAFNAEEDPYGEEHLIKLLHDNHQLGAQELLSLLIDDVNRFVGSTSPSDDITALVIKRV